MLTFTILGLANLPQVGPFHTIINPVTKVFINSSEITSDSYDNSVRVDEFELHHMYHLHSPANQFYAWSLHIDYDETGGDWAVPIDPV